MAKIQNGALTDKLQGRVGPVVFNWTRFGQVVKSFAKPPLNTTPAAMETKNTFRQAARTWGQHRTSIPFLALADIAVRAGRAPQGPFVSAYMRWMRGQPYSMPTHGQPALLTIDDSRLVAGRWQFHCEVNDAMASAALALAVPSIGEPDGFYGSSVLNFLPGGWSTSLTRVATGPFDLIGVAAVYGGGFGPTLPSEGGAVSFWHQDV